MNHECNYIHPVWQGDCVPQPSTICNYYLLTDNDWFFFTFQKQLIATLNLRVSDLLLEMFWSITIQVLCECVCAHSIVCVAALYKPIFHLQLTPKIKLIPFSIQLFSAKLWPQSSIQRLEMGNTSLKIKKNSKWEQNCYENIHCCLKMHSS